MRSTAPATIESVARELVELCRAGRNLDAINALYAPEIVSLEPAGNDQFPARTTGIDAIRKKNQWWFDAFEVRRHEVEGPYINGDQFAVKYIFEATEKKTGTQQDLAEIGVYTVKDGKIAQERFFTLSPEG